MYGVLAACFDVRTPSHGSRIQSAFSAIGVTSRRVADGRFTPILRATVKLPLCRYWQWSVVSALSDM